MKKVLILCTGNSCRSIIGEAVINKELGNKGIKAFSAGSKPTGKVNPNAIKVLKANSAWNSSYYSKSIDEIDKYAPFDLVITVCDNAKEACPMYHGAKKQLHLGFKDPDGKDYKSFEDTYNLIKEQLVDLVKKELL